jgi:hypothetical protein
MTEEAKQQEIVLDPHSQLTCSRCGRTDSQTYVARRRGKTYELLCITDGKGCYLEETRTLCPQTMPWGGQCSNRVEWDLIDVNGVRVRAVCGEHLMANMPVDCNSITLIRL